MPLDISRETRIYLALWRKAYREDGLTFDAGTPAKALAFRLALYRAIKPYRSDEFLDPELYKAGEEFCPSNEKDSSLIRIVSRQSRTMAEKAMESLGLSELELMTPEERAVQEKMLDELDRLDIKKAGSSLPIEEPREFEAPAKVVNPFFERD